MSLRKGHKYSSFPQTKGVKANRSAFKKGEITEEKYVNFNKKKIEECVKWQEESVIC